MDVLVTGAYAVFFILVILKSSFFRTGAISNYYIALVFILKIAAGILLGYLYRSYFNGGDTYLFFDNANKMFAILKESPADFLKIVTGLSNDPALQKYYNHFADWYNYEFFYNDSRTIIRLNAILRIFSFGIYNVHVVFFSFLSLAGLNGLFKIFTQAAPDKQKIIFAVVFLVPSVVFWTSGILKEGILMFAIGIFLFSIHKIILKKISVKILILICVSMIFLLLLKVYVFILLLPGIVAWVWSSRSSYKNVFLNFILSFFIFIVVIGCLKFVHPKMNIINIIYWKHHNFKVMTQYYGSGSYYDLPSLEPTFLGIVKNIPTAVLNVFIQPTWNHLHNPFAWAAVTENIIILFFILLSVLFRNKIRDEQKPLFYFSLFFALSLFALIGLTTPVIGSLVRYKAPALPFLLFACILLLDTSKLFRKKSF